MTDRALFIAGLVSLVSALFVLSQADYPFSQTPDWQVSER